MIKIMLQGRKGRGKDTLATFITQQLSPEPVFTTGFAKALKDDLRDEVVNYVYKHMGIVTEQTNYRNVMRIADKRENMVLGWQWFGEFMRQVDPNFWINRMYIPDDKHIIVTDCRHHNEAQWGFDNGFFIVKIVGPDHREPDGRDESHASERHVNDLSCHYTIVNEFSLDVLNAFAKIVISLAKEHSHA